jgi:hypothetical protein
MLIEPVLRYFVMKDLVVDYGRRIKAPDGKGDSEDADAELGEDS